MSKSKSRSVVTGFLSESQTNHINLWPARLMTILHVLKEIKVPTRIDLTPAPGVFVIKAKHMDKLWKHGILIGNESDFTDLDRRIQIPLVLAEKDLQQFSATEALYDGAMAYLEFKTRQANQDKLRDEAISELDPVLRRTLGL